MARIITKELALKIVAKLGARKSYRAGSRHDLYEVYYKDALVAHFGVRRGSERDKGHDHIPPQIFLSPGKAKRLGQCAMTDEQWVDEMMVKGKIPEELEPAPDRNPDEGREARG